MNSPFHYNSFHSFTADFTHHDAVLHDSPLTELHFLSVKKFKDVDNRWTLSYRKARAMKDSLVWPISNIELWQRFVTSWCAMSRSLPWSLSNQVILLLKEKHFCVSFCVWFFFFKYVSLLLFLDIAEVSRMWKDGQQWIFLAANKNLQSEMAGYCLTTIELYLLREKVNWEMKKKKIVFENKKLTIISCFS